MKIDYFLNGISVNPVKRENIYLEINHDQESVINQPRPHVGINNLYFALEDVQTIMAMLNQPPGITEGIPLDIKLTERGQSHTINMYLDLMEGLERSNDGIAAKVKMLQSLDWMDDKVDAFTFESMYNETGVIPFVVDGSIYPSYQQFMDSRCVYVPYVISSVPNFHDAFLAIFGLTYVGTQLYSTITKLIQWLTPIPGIGLVVPIGQFVIELAFAILLIATLISLVAQLIATLIQPLKYHGAMLVTDLLKVTAAKLGLKAQSSIWDTYPYNQLAYIPEKYSPIEGGENVFALLGFNVGGFGTKGYTSPGRADGSIHNSETTHIQHGYFNGTGGDLLRFIKKICNGKIIIPDGTNTLLLERRDYYPASTPYQLPDLRQDWNGYNTDELTANILIKFQTDLNERNCIDHISPGGTPFFPGTILQATHEQISTTNQLLVCLKGLKEIQINAARGVGKDKFTFIESVVNDLQVVWHAIENVLIGILNTAITVANLAIAVLNGLIIIWNIMIFVLHQITNVINIIIDAINTVPGISVDKITVFDNGGGTIRLVPFISYRPFVSLVDNSFSNRLKALLLENDILDVPKLVMIETPWNEPGNPKFGSSERIGYIHPQNASIVNALNLWNRFYSIDAFVGDIHNRFTKISPASNSSGEKNKCSLSLKNFKALVSNPKFLDNYSEEVIADSVQWYMEQNGAAEFSFRKKGWRSNPQHPNATNRSQEIAVNLKLKISTPNGQ